MPEYTGINHLALVTPDMQATIRFWRDLLGLRLVVGLGSRGYKHYFFQISGQDLVAFFEWSAVEQIAEKDHGVPVQGPFAFDHVSIGIKDLEGLWELKDRLDAAGFWVSEVVDHGFIYSLYSFDPNNIPIEFSVQSPELDVRNTPCMADKSPCPAVLEGPEPQPGHWPEVSQPSQEEDKLIFPGEGKELKEAAVRGWPGTKGKG
ncbi:MAG: VOC family protein [Desulfohalobiaceae bacterium]